jgi:hypothetical protein
MQKEATKTEMLEILSDDEIAYVYLWIMKHGYMEVDKDNMVRQLSNASHNQGYLYNTITYNPISGKEVIFIDIV